MKLIGIDPDTKKYGVAVYINNKLTELLSLDVVSLFHLLKDSGADHCGIEDVKKNSFIYARNIKDNTTIGAKIAQDVGACKHSQEVAERFIEHFGIPIIRVKPSAGNWAANKKNFELMTGWKGRSNDDKRAAAWVGYHALAVAKRNSMIKK